MHEWLPLKNPREMIRVNTTILTFNLPTPPATLKVGGGDGCHLRVVPPPLGNFIEGQARPNVLIKLCFSHVITYGSRIFCITFQSI